MIVLFQSVGCGGSKGAVSSQVYSVLENTIVAKNKAERDLQTYTNLVSSYAFFVTFYAFVMHCREVRNSLFTVKAVLFNDIVYLHAARLLF